MRTRSLACLAVVSLVTVALAADEVVRMDGGVVTGKVVEVVVETSAGKVRVTDPVAVRMTLDRAALDAQWLVSNLRFALARERSRAPAQADVEVGVFMGAGVSAPSAQAVVRRLDAQGKPPRLLFEPLDLSGLGLVVFPGGWAPSQDAAIGEQGRAALRQFVGAGGCFLGICAGSYLPCSAVVWEGTEHEYPLGLALGRAVGPVEGLVAWPGSQGVTIEVDDDPHSVLYAGGCSFEIPGADVIGRYTGGAPSVVEVEHGKGRMILTGVHPEFTAAESDLLAGWADGVKPGDGELFRALVVRLLRDEGRKR